MTEATRMMDLNAADMVTLALNNPEQLFSINPHAVWASNKHWVMRWKPHWAAMNKPMDMLDFNPAWMCAIYPGQVVLLNINVMMEHYPSWVVENRPDIYVTIPRIAGDHAPMPAFVKKQFSEVATKIGLFDMIKGWFEWLHTPKFHARLPDSLLAVARSRKRHDEYYPPGVRPPGR